jgi:hypothetical protein
MIFIGVRLVSYQIQGILERGLNQRDYAMQSNRSREFRRQVRMSKFSHGLLMTYLIHKPEQVRDYFI